MIASHAASAVMPDDRRAVLDTNVCLALWLFGDVRLRPLDRALRDGGLRWVLAGPMLDELRREVRPTRCARYGTSFEAVWATIDSVPMAIMDAPLLPIPHAPRCTDPDDQIFIDLALAVRIPLLLSRDRAVLKLRRKAHLLGLDIQAPDAWLAAQSAATTGSDRPLPPQLPAP
jgi:predicted nucleic acid-binding protein